MLTTKFHATLDYLLAAIITCSPWLLDYSALGMARDVSVIVGVSLIVYSVFTDYELGAVSVFQKQSHLVLDIIGGLFLAISPWLYDFSDYVFFPHVSFGLILIATAILTFKVIPQPRQVTDLNYNN